MLSATTSGTWSTAGEIDLDTFTNVADAAAKATDIQLLEIRLANGLGGKSFVLMEGTVADVEASVAAGVELVRQEGLLIRQVVIPQLHEQMRAMIL